MNPQVFREYDIRGVAERDMSDDFVTDLGRAIGSALVDAGGRRMTVGRDCRLHSPRIHRALTAGLLETGICIQDIGIVHTPGLYFSVFHLEADGGVMITASHNPSEDNGFKVMRGTGTIHGDEIQDLRRRIEARRFVVAPRPGTVEEVKVLPRYIDHIVDNIELGERRMKVVVDAGNGTGGLSCVPILQRLGIEVEQLYCDPDGRFPNHHPDPTVPANLRDLTVRVQASGAELGIALDGDADRIGVVDRRGRIVWGDQLLILFSRDILRQSPGAVFVSEVKGSQALYDDVAAHGGKAIMWKVGHSLIKAKMRAEGAALAGEMSGHMFFAHRYFGFDDAVYAGARLIELLSRSDQTLEQMVDTIPARHNTPEIRFSCPDEIKFEVVRRAVEHFRREHPVVDVDGARVSFPDGWGLVRASNTGPVLVMRFEADSPEAVSRIHATFETTISSIIADVSAGR